MPALDPIKKRHKKFPKYKIIPQKGIPETICRGKICHRRRLAKLNVCGMFKEGTFYPNKYVRVTFGALLKRFYH